MIRHCRKCKNEIPKIRLDALPHTRTCVDCSDVTAPVGHMSWEHKTAPMFQIVQPSQSEWFHRHRRVTAGARLPFSRKS
jgi:hypothetical protein